MILTAVGARYMALTLCYSTALHNTPGLGIIGLPSKNTDVAPLIKGPYTMKLCPTTHPMSLAENQTSPLFISKIFFIVQLRATTVPPVSLTTPFGAPVVPDVSIKGNNLRFSHTKNVERMCSFNWCAFRNIFFFVHEFLIVKIFIMS